MPKTRSLTELPEVQATAGEQSDSVAIPAKRTRKASQRQASTEGLLGAALRLFVSQGYRATNLEQISGAAKLSKGAVYFYFRSKEAVLLELLRSVERIVVDRAVARVMEVGPRATDKLVAYLHYQAGLGISHRDEVLLLILMSLEFKEREGPVLSFIDQLNQRQRQLIEDLVRSGQRAGEFRADLHARELAAIVLAINDGTFLEWFRRSKTLDGPELVRALRAAVLGATAIQRTSPS